MNIPVYTREVYGNRLIYVADSGLAKTFEHLLGKKTLSLDNLVQLEDLGFTIEQVVQPLR